MNIQKQKKLWHVVGEVFPVVLAAFLLFIVCKSSNQMLSDMPILHTLKGEYCQNGGEWMLLSEDTKLSALDGDILIRGTFGENIPKGTIIQFYMDHIEVAISVNGKEVFLHEPIDRQTAIAMCGTAWGSMESPGITTGDVIEIKLRNPHKFGNCRAYSEFLHTIYTGSETALREMLGTKTFAFRWCGIVVMIISLVLMGVSLAFSIMHHAFGVKLRNYGLLALFLGVYVTLDTMDVSFWSHLVVFNTHALCLSILFAFWELGMLIRRELNSRAESVAAVVVIIEKSVIVVITTLCLGKVVLLYDAMLLWICMQLLICPLLFGCCIYEIRFRMV